MTSKKNENRKSTVKGILANTKEQTFEQFEIETEYTRSNVKAAELVREAMKLDDFVLVSVMEIVNEPVKKIEYDAQSLTEFASEIFTDEEEANKFAEANNCELVKFERFTYTAQIWAVIGEEYKTEFHTYVSCVKLGKVDTRAALVMNYEKQNKGAQVIGIHADERKAEKCFAAITAENLEQVKTR